MLNVPVKKGGLQNQPTVAQTCRCPQKRDFQKNGRCPHCGGLIGVVGTAHRSGKPTS